MVRQNCPKRLRISGTHSKARANRKERGSQRRTSPRTRRVSTDKIDRWRWSPQRFLVYSRWLHLLWSHWNLELNSMCRGWNIPIPLKYIDVVRVNAHRFGRDARKNRIDDTGNVHEMTATTRNATHARNTSQRDWGSANAVHVCNRIKKRSIKNSGQVQNIDRAVLYCQNKQSEKQKAWREAVADRPPQDQRR